MVKCPRCGMAVSEATKKWDYGVFHVMMYVCGKCEKSFKAYYRDNKLSHTIPKSK